MVLQQLAQLRQSVSFHTSLSSVTIVAKSFLGGFASIFERKRFSFDL
jgi:hypothetical protein